MKKQKCWTKNEIKSFIKLYPVKGKNWCINFFKRTEGSIRSKALELKIKQDKKSDFFKDWQNRAAKSKIGKKRPGQSIVMKNLIKSGKIKPMTSEKAKILFKDRWKNKEHPRGMLGKHHTKENRIIAINNFKNAWLDKNNYLNSKEYRQIISDRASKLQQSVIFRNRYSKAKIGDYDINGKKMFFRSSWEANYALYLDFLIKQNQIEKWEYETETFWFEKIKRGVRSYKPDFKVFKKNGDIEYHEVKGWMDNKSKTKLKRMKKYYPLIKIILIDKDIYKDIKNKVGKMLKFY